MSPKPTPAFWKSKKSTATSDIREVLDLLSSLNIKFNKFDHPPVFTCRESDKYWVNTQAAHTKSLFLKTETSPCKYFLYILECKKRADLKHLAACLGTSRLTFGSAAELKNLLNLQPGSVSPFGLIHDKNHSVSVLCDSDLSQAEGLLLHPNSNTATVEISWPNFQKFLSHTGHKANLVTHPT